jgi:hypothetical protein
VVGRRFASILAVVVLVVLAACTRRAQNCWVCEREVHEPVKTTLILEGGRKALACCPRCALHYEVEGDRKVREIVVTDYDTGRPIPYGNAWLVEGSDETPCVHHPPVVDEAHTPTHVCFDRCRPSLIAFASEAGARGFSEEHGGMVFPPGRFPGLPRAAR